MGARNRVQTHKIAAIRTELTPSELKTMSFLNRVAGKSGKQWIPLSITRWITISHIIERAIEHYQFVGIRGWQERPASATVHLSAWLNDVTHSTPTCWMFFNWHNHSDKMWTKRFTKIRTRTYRLPHSGFTNWKVQPHCIIS